MTHTYAVLEISRAAYDEIAGKLRAAGYGQAFNTHTDDDRGEVEVIDMHGIAVKAEPYLQGRGTHEGCSWPDCTNDALCSSGNLGGQLVCGEHFAITNSAGEGAPQTPEKGTEQMTEHEDYEQIRQILAADMALRPPSARLPEPEQPLGPLASAVYGLVQEVRDRRPRDTEAAPTTGESR